MKPYISYVYSLMSRTLETRDLLKICDIDNDIQSSDSQPKAWGNVLNKCLRGVSTAPTRGTLLGVLLLYSTGIPVATFALYKRWPICLLRRDTRSTLLDVAQRLRSPSVHSHHRAPEHVWPCRLQLTRTRPAPRLQWCVAAHDSMIASLDLSLTLVCQKYVAGEIVRPHCSE